MNVQLNSAVHRDIREAMEYYLETATGQISLEFYEEFQHFAELAAKSPLSFRVYAEDPTEIRRVNLDRFPYHFLFRQIDQITIRILVVRHDHRHPSYGLDRW